MSELTQRERLTARITQLLRDNPLRVFHLTVVADQNGEPLLWFVDAPVKVEGKQEVKDSV